MSMKQLILIRGIPGSGKSTLAKTLSAELLSHVHLEADMHFIGSDGVYRFDASKLYEAHKQCQNAAEKLLSANFTVIVSNTFTTLKELRPYFEIAKKFDLVPVVYLAQNQFKNVHDVPEEKLEIMRNRFQYDLSPLFKEFA